VSQTAQSWRTAKECSFAALLIHCTEGLRKDCAKKNVEKDLAITRFINICWSFFKLGAVLAVLVAVGLAIFLFTRLDDEIRRQVQQKLAQQFPQYNVSVGGARLVEGEGIAIYKLAISETSSTHLQNNLLVVDEIMLVCDAQLTGLMKGYPEVHRVVVRRPQLWAARASDGRWNLSSLWPLPKLGKKKPQVVIENAQLTIADQSRTGLAPLSLRDVNFTINPIADGPSTKLTSASTNSTPPAEPNFEIRGTLGGPNVERAEFHAHFNPSSTTLQLSVNVKQLQITKNLMAWATALGGKQLSQTSLRGKVDGEVIVSHQFGSQMPPQINAKLHLQGGRLEDPRLPQPLVDLSCSVSYEHEVLKIQQLQANCGSASVALHLERRGLAPSAPTTIGIALENVTLDKKLYGALPSVLKDQWDKYRPSGTIDAEMQATFDGQQWRPVAKLTGRELAFESDKFRYRVNDGSGTMQYTPREQGRPAVLDINLVGYAGGQPLQFVGQAFDPRPGALGWVEITGTNVEIEQRMIAALPEKTRRVIKSMHPQGKFNVRWRLDRTQPGQIKPHTALRLELVDCQVNYEKFPYPLSGIHGLVLAEDQRWTFRDLVSTGSRNVQCQGYLQPTPAGNQLSLQFTGAQIPLDEDLRQALPSAVQRAWQELHPRGNVDLRAEVSYVTGLTKPTIRVEISPRPESTTIQPKFFPYLMEQLEGSISYQNGQLLMSQLRARHGRTTLRTNGNGQFNPDGSWHVQLEGLSVDRLIARRDLTDALPLKLQKLIDYLRPSGSFSLSNGALRFSKANAANATVNAEWDVQLNCLQADLQAGVELHNVHGAVRLVGASQGRKSYSAGELAIDSATFEDIQFTEIRGPLWVDEGRCLFGEWATKEQGHALRRLQAKVYDGDLTADAWVSFDVVPRYSATAKLTGANLNRIMKERINGQLDYSGLVEGSLTLNGKGRSLATLNGHGEVQVTEANIYELPLLVGMLKVLRNETPNSTAFNQCNTKFRIKGPHITLDQLDFLGDAVSLLGRGETDFDHNLKLDFHAVVGRNEIRIPFVKKFVNRVGQQTLQMSVDGTLSDPQVHTQALPGINQLIQQIQSDLDITKPSTDLEPRKAERFAPTLPRWGRQ